MAVQLLSPSPRDERQSLQDLLDLQSLVVDRGVHEIRGLLVAGGYAKLLLDQRVGPVNAAQREYLQTVVQNTQRIKEILDALGSVTQLGQFEVTRFRLGEFLDDVLKTAAFSESPARLNGNALLATQLVGDRKKLRDAVTLLLRRHLGASGVTAEIQGERLWIGLVFRGPFARPDSGLADEVLLAESMRSRAGASLPEDVVASSIDIVRMHGGSLSVQQLESGSCEILLKLPYLTSGPATNGAANV